MRKQSETLCCEIASLAMTILVLCKALRALKGGNMALVQGFGVKD
jgi:hypothetical protein